MKKLDDYITGKGEVKGIHFQLVKRIGNLCCYERSDGVFEIFVPIQQKARTAVFDGVTVNYEEKEVYPTGEGWNGKSTKNKFDALKIFERQLKVLQNE